MTTVLTFGVIEIAIEEGVLFTGDGLVTDDSGDYNGYINGTTIAY